MAPKKLDDAAMSAWVETLVGREHVYAPQARGERFAYDRLHRAQDLRLDHDITILPPKKYLLPPRQAMLTFTRNGEFHAVEDAEPMVLLGVHPYDVAAIARMDRYFTQDNPDAHYIARRKKTRIVACDVENPSRHVFAASMGTAAVREGFDVLLTRVDSTYIAQAATPGGEQLLAAAGDLPDADPISLGRREQVWMDAQKMLRQHGLKCGLDELPALLEESFDHPVWKERSETCFSCGSCVMVCPTCFCFDVQDDLGWDLSAGTRSRRWDACLLSEFALVAGGHNFRKQREERYRHRFYRKGKYLHDRCGFVACVGCGRCTVACPSGIANPADLYNVLLEDQ